MYASNVLAKYTFDIRRTRVLDDIAFKTFKRNATARNWVI